MVTGVKIVVGGGGSDKERAQWTFGSAWNVSLDVVEATAVFTYVKTHQAVCLRLVLFIEHMLCLGGRES